MKRLIFSFCLLRWAGAREDKNVHGIGFEEELRRIQLTHITLRKEE
jgi:hypothetical protein